MVAYRLHFERATLDSIDTIRSGEFGDVMLFPSAFAPTAISAPPN
jgi:hypothetical protein